MDIPQTPQGVEEMGFPAPPHAPNAENPQASAPILDTFGDAPVSVVVFEYEPKLHRVHIFTRANFLALPQEMGDFPDSAVKLGIIHPDDISLFLETVQQIDVGAQNAQCDIRASVNGVYRWYYFRLDCYFLESQNKNVVFGSIVDVTLRVNAEQDYENQIRALMQTNEDTIGVANINLSAHIVSNPQGNGVLFGPGARSNLASCDKVLQGFAHCVIDEADREKLLKEFTYGALIEQAAAGAKKVSMQHLLRAPGRHPEWVETGVEFIKNPRTNEIEGFGYAKSVNNVRMANLILGQTIYEDYAMVSVVFADTGEYYLFDAKKQVQCVYHSDFWSDIKRVLPMAASGKDSEIINSLTTREQIVDALEATGEFSVSFNGCYHDRDCRFEFRCGKLDCSHDLIMASVRDVTGDTLYKKARYDSRHDSVTGLYNRKAVFERAEQLLSENPDTEYAVLHFDIKRFRLYNSFFGEKAGDDLLRFIAQLLEEFGQDSNLWTYGRIEADVFCLVFPYEKEDFEAQLKKFLRRLADYSENFTIESSIGVYRVRDCAMPIETMFARATTAAKKIRENPVLSLAYFDDKMERELLEEVRISTEMRSALDQGQFKVFLQPKYDLASGHPVGAEALVRWDHPVRGLVSPVGFVPVFERNGFIVNLDRYMWESVCKLLRAWIDAGHNPYPISVNLSRVSMYSPYTVPFLKLLLEKYQLEPNLLQLELTESAYMEDPDEMKRQLQQLHDAGFTILMDDFGSGFSSLNALGDIPVDVLKLDAKFLSNRDDDMRARKVLKSVLGMAQDLKLPVVAEGVETEFQARLLRELGCEYAQGFLFAKPMPSDSYEHQGFFDAAACDANLVTF